MEIKLWKFHGNQREVVVDIADQRSAFWLAHVAKITLFDDDQLKIWYDGPSGILKLEDKRRPDLKGMMCTITTTDDIWRWLSHYEHLTFGMKHLIIAQLFQWIPPLTTSEIKENSIEGLQQEIEDKREARD